MFFNKRLKADAAMAKAKKRLKSVLIWVKYMHCCQLVFIVNFSLFINNLFIYYLSHKLCCNNELKFS